MKRTLFAFAFLLVSAYGASSLTSMSLSKESSGTSDVALASRDQTLMNPIILETPVDSTYIIGPGDVFQIFAEGTNLSVQVSPDGAIGLEQVGLVDVGGKTLAESRKAILAALSKRYMQKECFVVLGQLKKFKVDIYGAVVTTGQQVLEGGSRLSALLRAVGGITSSANMDSVLLMRGKDTTKLHLLEADLKGSTDQDPMLKQGDVVVIPFLNLSGKVVTVRTAVGSRVVPWQEGATVDDYLNRSRLYRREENQYTHLHLSNLTTGKEETVELSAGRLVRPDAGTVLEPMMQKPSVYVGGVSAHVGRFDYDPKFTPYEYVTLSGLTPVSANYGPLHVVRKDGKEEWIDPIKGVINPGDYIEIPRSTYENVKDVTVFIATVISVFSTMLIAYISYQNSKK